MKTTRLTENMNKITQNENRIREDKKMKTTTVEIMNRMTAFENGKYTRVELINELFKLQNEMAIITFGETQAEGKRFYDISDHFANMNRENRRISAEMMEEFRKECGAATNSIIAEIYGSKGEYKTFNKLESLRTEHRIRKNVEVGDETKRTEIDALIVTEKAAFIIEVKNTKRDIFIDENGDYYRTGEFLKLDSKLGEKLELREEFVKRAAEKSGINNLKIVKIVVFTDNRIKVQNKCKSIKTCFLNNLTSIIDYYDGEKEIKTTEIDSIMKSVDEITTNFKYEPDIDIKKFKTNFAQIVTEMNREKETKSWFKTWKAIVTSFTTRRAA